MRPVLLTLGIVLIAAASWFVVSTAPATAPATSAVTPAASSASTWAPSASASTVPPTSISTTMPASSPPYRRAAFGSAWSDVDGNGCDTRDDILARDLTATVVSSTCKVLSGTLADPYTGKTVAFTRGSRTSADVQIDHIVSLSDAWRSGAYAWTPQQRLAFANDPLNLRAVSGPANNTKGDKGPSLWMPHVAGNAAFDCTYATEYTQVLVKYHLPAPPEDAAALAAACK